MDIVNLCEHTINFWLSSLSKHCMFALNCYYLKNPQIGKDYIKMLLVKINSNEKIPIIFIM